MTRLHKISGCENTDRKADVIFVHGLGGDPFTTWRHGNGNSTSWPHWLGEEFPELGVWSLGYPASVTKWTRFWGSLFSCWHDSGHGMSLPDRAVQVLDLMVQCGLGQRPLFFIAHSLGGLVVKQLLRASSDAVDAGPKDVFNQTRAVMFLSTPHAGVALASLANNFRIVFGSTASLHDLRAHDAHLRNLYDWYRNHSTGCILTASYYEQRSFKGVTIVNPTSAHPGVGRNPVPLDEDHVSIAKPRERENQVCNAARDLLHTVVLASNVSIATQAADLQRLLAELGKGNHPSITDPSLQLLLASLLDENRRLRDENVRLKMNDTERRELRTMLTVVQQLLSKRDRP